MNIIRCIGMTKRVQYCISLSTCMLQVSGLLAYGRPAITLVHTIILPHHQHVACERDCVRGGIVTQQYTYIYIYIYIPFDIKHTTHDNI